MFSERNSQLLILQKVNSIALTSIKSFNLLCENDDRINIMKLISKVPQTITTISKKLNIPKSRAYRHLRLLQSIGWIKSIEIEEMKILGYNVNSRSTYYIPSAILYIGCIVSNKGTLELREDYVALVNTKCGKFILKTPRTELSCSENCEMQHLCSRWIEKLCKRYNIELDSQRISTLLLKICVKIAIQELTKALEDKPILISNSGISLLYSRLFNPLE